MNGTKPLDKWVSLLPYLEFVEEALAAHNKLRTIHGTPPMTLDKTMSADAEAYATKLARLGVLKHAEPAERNNDGENLAYTCQSNDPGYKGQEPTARWWVWRSSTWHLQKQPLCSIKKLFQKIS